MRMMKCKAFTLAEVLITLGIIGIVAALTIPTLIANTKSQQFRSQFKKTLSTLNQAGLMAKAQYDFDYAGANGGIYKDFGGQAGAGYVKCSATDNPETTKTFCAIFNSTLAGSVNMTDSMINTINQYSWNDYKTLGNNGNYNVIYLLADGSMIGFKSFGGYSCTLAPGETVEKLAVSDGTCLGFIDVNGINLPNKEVSCGDDVETKLFGENAQNCTVPNNSTNMTDVFPIVFHDATVEPASNAAKYVLNSTK